MVTFNKYLYFMFRTRVPSSAVFLSRFYARENYVRNAKAHLNAKESGRLPSDCYAQGKYLIFVNQLKSLLVSREERHTLKLISYDEVLKLGIKAEEHSILLSSGTEDWIFAVAISTAAKERAKDIESEVAGKIIPFRTSLFTLTPTESAISSKALALLKWNEEFNFCSSCGQKLTPAPARTQKKCVSCHKSHYPAVNPVGITLVRTYDNSKILLVRQHSHPPGMYTCIAGFVESGESIEENIRREVAEEVGIAVEAIQYVSSQHWAFPINSLMIGCTAAAEEQMLSIDHEELEDAKWFTPEQVRNAVQRITQKNKEVLKNSSEIWIPPPGALAHTLITHWLQTHEQ
ncbi:NAD(P)H pyrophosphatase NUDT13, mitochondrial-like [Schistocerca nitens]|uniref:NAD(P)H pyrophosphatase NUDT13, mitochondrial-like n=1 Tax=Schistocerca nitens TaxID=7011 RepID=UPI0021182767|nr:NAD(P)H pyrophosphatase NUDT13, mitochondrial-like [Schistocerca nitens]